MLSGALEEQNLRLSAGPSLAADLCADTCIYLEDGSRVRTHSLVLAAGSAYFRHLAQVDNCWLHCSLNYYCLYTKYIVYMPTRPVQYAHCTQRFRRFPN
jgi:hypothetical protein